MSDLVTSKPDRDNERAYVNIPMASQWDAGSVAIVGAYPGAATGSSSLLDREDAVALRDKLTELIEKHDAEQPLFRAGDFVIYGERNAIVVDDVSRRAASAFIRHSGGSVVVRPELLKKVTV